MGKPSKNSGSSSGRHREQQPGMPVFLVAKRKDQAAIEQAPAGVPLARSAAKEEELLQVEQDNRRMRRADVLPSEAVNPVPYRGSETAISQPSHYPANAAIYSERQQIRREKRLNRSRLPKLGNVAIALSGALLVAAISGSIGRLSANTSAGDECSAPYMDDGIIKLESCVALLSKDVPNKLVRGIATFALIMDSAEGDHIGYSDELGYGFGVVSEINDDRFYEVYGRDAKDELGNPVDLKDLTPGTYFDSVCGFSSQTHAEAVKDLAQLVEAGKKAADRISKGTKYAPDELKIRRNVYTALPYTPLQPSRPADNISLFSLEKVQAVPGAPAPTSPIERRRLDCGFPAVSNT